MRNFKYLILLLVLAVGLAGCGGKKYQPVTSYSGQLPANIDLQGKKIVVIGPLIPDFYRKFQAEKIQFQYMLADALNKLGANAVVDEGIHFPPEPFTTGAYAEKLAKYDYLFEVEMEKPVLGKKNVCETEIQVLSTAASKMLTLGLNPGEFYKAFAHYNRNIVLMDVAKKKAVWGKLTEGYAEKDLTVYFDHTVLSGAKREALTMAQQKELSNVLEEAAKVVAGEEM